MFWAAMRFGQCMQRRRFTRRCYRTRILISARKLAMNLLSFDIWSGCLGALGAEKFERKKQYLKKNTCNSYSMTQAFLIKHLLYQFSHDINVTDLSIWTADFKFLLLFFQAEDGIRDVERSRGLGDVYKRQALSQKNSSPKHCQTCSVVCARVWQAFWAPSLSAVKNVVLN